MANKPNNPWIQEKQELLKDTAILRPRQKWEKATGEFTGTDLYLDITPTKTLAAILLNQHEYVARRRREGVLIDGLNYERLAKRVWQGSVVNRLVGTQPMRLTKDKVYYMQYRVEGAESSGWPLDSGRRVSLEIFSNPIRAKDMKYSTGVYKDCITNLSDLSAIHSGLSTAEEIEKIIAASIVEEQENRYINKLIDISHKEPSFDFASCQSTYPTFMGDRFQLLAANIFRGCTNIARLTRRGAGNWVICSPMVVSVLQASKIEWDLTPNGFKSLAYTHHIGKMQGTIDVYCHLPEGKYADETVLIGYKGTSGELDAGLFYCPHTLITHQKRKNKDGRALLPFGSKEAIFEVPNASSYYTSFKIDNFNFA